MSRTETVAKALILATSVGADLLVAATLLLALYARDWGLAFCAALLGAVGAGLTLIGWQMWCDERRDCHRPSSTMRCRLMRVRDEGLVHDHAARSPGSRAA